VKYTVQLPEVFTYFFFILPEPYSSNGDCHLDHNAPIDADFLNEVPLGCRELKKMLGFKAAQNLKKFLTIAQTRNS
jgi:hypothetical protein